MFKQIKLFFCRSTILLCILPIAYLLYLAFSSCGYFLSAGTVITLLLLIIFSVKSRQFTKHTANIITAGCMLILISIQLFLIFTTYRHNLPWADSLSVFNEAITMAASETPSITDAGRYFEMYGNNYFFTILLCYYFKFFHLFGLTAYWIEGLFLNMIAMDLGVIFCLYTIQRIKGEQTAALGAIFCMCNPVLYVFLPFVYTNTISIAFTMGIFCIAILLSQETSMTKCICYSIIEGALIAVGFQIRVTTIIPVIALTIWYILQKTSFVDIRRDIKLLMVLLITFLFLFSGCKLLINSHAPEELRSKNFPVTHWIMMGLHEDGQYYSPDEDFTYNITTKEDKVSANLKEIKTRASSLLKKGPIALLDFITKKLQTTWYSQNDGLYIETGRLQKYSNLQPYLFGYKNNLLLFWYHLYKILLFVCILIGLCREFFNKNSSQTYPYMLTLLGFIIFYLLWESNCRYTICLTLLLSLLATFGLDDIPGKLSEQCFFKKIKIMIAIYILLGVTLPGLYKIYKDYHLYTQEPVLITDSNILTVTRSYHENLITDIIDTNSVFTQTFTSEHPFNEVGIYCSYIGSDKWDASMASEFWYQFILKDDSGNILAQSEFPSEGNGNYFKLFGFDTIVPKKETTYTIEISKSDNAPTHATDRIGFVYFDFSVWDYIENAELSVNNENIHRDLIFTVRHNHLGTYTTTFRYLVYCAGVTTLLTCIAILLLFEKRLWNRFYSSIFCPKLLQ